MLRFLQQKRERPYKSVGLILACIKTFLVENDVELSEKFWRSIRRRVKGTRALTLDQVPSNVEIRKMIMHMPVNGKALYLTLASSGMRIGEALQLKIDDLNMDHNPINIQGSYTKTGSSRIALISHEAKEAVEEWLKSRSQYIKTAVGRSQVHEKSIEDTRLFPFELNTAHYIWTNASKKVGNGDRDKTTNRHLIHPHVLRKFFRTNMARLIPVDIVEALMGHEGYLTEVYRKYSQEDLSKFYLQGVPSILVFTEAGEVTKLKQEVEERNKTLQTLVNGLTTENLELKSRTAKVELENTELKSRIIKIEKSLEEVKSNTWRHY